MTAPMMIVMPWAVKALGIPDIVGGAWIGGTIDTSGAVVAAGGMAIVAVLVMRALGEWREIEDRERAGHAPR